MAGASLQARLIGTGDVRIPRIDYLLLFSTIALAMLGLVMVASASITIADRELGHPFYYALRQCIYIGMGLFIGLLLFRVLVPGVGVEVNGATRWINAGLFRLQVSEPAKLCFIIYLASYLARHQEHVCNRLTGFLKPAGLLGLAALLLLAEPDFGSAVVLGATVMGMIFMAGVRLVHFTGAMALAGMLLGGAAVSSSYRMERLKTFLDPWADPFDSGFQLTQSLMAIGRGEWFGVGLGSSIQKLFYLP
jgi:cell division protein FtsW